MMNKINKPCFFYNTGGCYHDNGKEKTAIECKYLHVHVTEPLEKPQHLKPPCKFYHLRGSCTNPYCVFGHSELSKDRWHKYFPGHQYPGHGYGHSKDFDWRVEEVDNNREKVINMILQLLDKM